MKRWSAAVGAALLALLPNIGVVALTVSAFLRRDLPRDRWVWAAVLAAPLLLPVPFQLLGGQPAWEPLVQALVVALMVVVCAGERRALAAGLAAGLALLVGVGFLTQGYRAQLLTPDSSSMAAQIRGTSHLGPRSMYWSTAKEWRIDHGVEAVQIEFDLRLAEGTPGTDWYRYHPEITIEPCGSSAGRPGGCSRVSVPESPEAGLPLNLSRELDTGEALGGRTFRLSASLRSETKQSTWGCDGLVLQENGGSFRGQCQPVVLDDTWTEYQAEWDVPEEVAGSELRVLLSNITSDFEVAGVGVEELRDGEWHALGPLEPFGLQVSVRNPGTSRQDVKAKTFMPTQEWKRQRAVLDTSGLLEEGVLRLNFQTEGLIGLAVRDLSVRPSGSERELVPLNEQRWSLGYGQPNLLGHSAATAGAAIAVLAAAPAVQGLGLVAALVLVLQSGSRAALVALVAFVALFVLAGRGRRLKIVLPLAAAAAVLGVVVFAPQIAERFLSFQDGNSVPRSEIRSTAVAVLEQRPLLGLGAQSFRSFWAEENAGWANVAPSHAHNFVLQLAARYGIPGLLAGSAFLLLLARYAWQRRRVRGLLLLVPVLVMNFFDFTLFFPGVLATLLLGIQGRSERTEMQATNAEHAG